MASIVKSTPYHLQIYEILRDRILNGNFKTGERIFENKISQELGVSRSPVREALRILEQDELLVSTPAGLIVNPMEYKNMVEIYQCRMAVEPFAAKLSAEKLQKEDFVYLKELVNLAKEYHSQKCYDKVVEQNTKFHDLIVRKCDNSRLISIVEKIRSLIILSRFAEFQCYQRNEEYLNEHESILEALIERSGEKTEQRLRQHIINDFEFYKEQSPNKF